MGNPLKKIKKFVDDTTDQLKGNVRDARDSAGDYIKNDLLEPALGEQGAEWLSAFASGLGQSGMDIMGANAIYAFATSGDVKPLVNAPADMVRGLIDVGTAGIPSAYEAYVKVNDGTNGQGSGETPPDIASMYANDPDTSAQFQRMRKSARMLGRAGTIKYKGSGTSLGLGEQMLGDQMSLIGA